jgi:glycosyltransferase involved in cell wall biosynthesis
VTDLQRNDSRDGEVVRAPRVLIATMMFPVPSEAFAGVEIRALLEAGVRVRVRALRRKHRLADKLLLDWRLQGMDATHSDARSLLRGMLCVLTRPGAAFWAVRWLLRDASRTPGLFFRCVALMPRMFDILRECERDPPTILHLFWGHYPAVLAGLVKRRLPAIHLSMSLGAYDLVYRFGASIAAANAADSLWTHAQCNVEPIRLMGIRNPRLEVLRRGIDLSQVPHPPYNRIAGRIVAVARLVRDKGVDDVIRAFAEASKRLPHLQLVIIGEGPDRRRLEHLAEDLGLPEAIQFVGAAPHSRVYRELVQADAFMLLSRSASERLPNAVKEAMACGCLCITTRTPGIEELRAHPDNPLVVDPGQWAEAAQMLIDVLTRPERYVEARERGRAFVLREFDSKTLAARRMSVWSAAKMISGAVECAE